MRLCRIHMAGLAGGLCLLAGAASAQTAPIGSSPIPNGLSGGRETFTPSPLTNGVGQTGSVVPLQAPLVTHDAPRAASPPPAPRPVR